MTDLPYLASRLYGTPLLIARPKLEVILGVVARKLAGDALATPPPANVDAGMSGGLQVQDGIAVLPVLGTLVRRASYIGAASGLTSYHDIAPSVSIVVVPLEEIYDEWDRAFLSGIATKLYGARTVASRKSTPWSEGEVIDRGDGETWTAV